MPYFEQNGVRIRYMVAGDPLATPILAIAPGGLRSALSLWEGRPWDPLRDLPGHHVVVMDQRNAGESWAPITAGDSWHSYTADQLALMDHLGIDRFHVAGMCIGGPYCLALMQAAPDRVVSGVLFQPIGLQDNRDAFHDLFAGWRGDITTAHPEATSADWGGFRAAMFGSDFVFALTRDEVATIETPMLVFMGDDLYHPSAISRGVAALAPNAELIEDWKTGNARVAAASRVREFLAG